MNKLPPKRASSIRTIAEAKKALGICQRCNGTGQEPDRQSIGSKMRDMRKAAGLSLRTLGVLMNLSAPFLSDCERGNRAFSADRMAEYARFCLPAKAARNRARRKGGRP